jgi:hypothetical protein
MAHIPSYKLSPEVLSTPLVIIINMVYIRNVPVGASPVQLRYS